MSGRWGDDMLDSDNDGRLHFRVMVFGSEAAKAYAQPIIEEALRAAGAQQPPRSRPRLRVLPDDPEAES
jgi:hypothetical protein